MNFLIAMGLVTIGIGCSLIALGYLQLNTEYRTLDAQNMLISEPFKKSDEEVIFELTGTYAHFGVPGSKGTLTVPMNNIKVATRIKEDGTIDHRFLTLPASSKTWQKFLGKSDV